MTMTPAVNKEDTTYIQMHSAISQANTIRDSLTATTARHPSLNGGSIKTFTNSPVTGQYLLMLYCLHCHFICYCTRTWNIGVLSWVVFWLISLNKVQFGRQIYHYIFWIHLFEWATNILSSTVQNILWLNVRLHKHENTIVSILLAMG